MSLGKNLKKTIAICWKEILGILGVDCGKVWQKGFLKEIVAAVWFSSTHGDSNFSRDFFLENLFYSITGIMAYNRCEKITFTEKNLGPVFVKVSLKKPFLNSNFYKI